MKLTKTGIGLLTRLYRSVLKKCFLINAGLFFALAPSAADATAPIVVNDGEVIEKVEGTFNTPGSSGAAILILGGSPGGRIDLITNSVFENISGGYGASIMNSARINSITNTVFRNNTSSGQTAGIYTTSYLGTLAADFIDNTAYTAGVAVQNWHGRIDTIIGNYIRNIGTGDGGAIFNGGTGASIGTINANFDSNLVKSADAVNYGGAIYTYMPITSIYGTFTNNGVEGLSSANAEGGAIYNIDSITNIGSADNPVLFQDNYVSSESNLAHGGAIWNSGNIGTIYADFINNKATSGSTSSSNAQGAAIYNSGTIGLVVGDFKGNIASNTQGNIISNDGGAIYNSGTMSITGSFYDNSAGACAGAIANVGTMNLIASSGHDIYFRNNISTTSNGGSYYYDIINNGTLNLNAASGQVIDFGGAVKHTDSGVQTINLGNGYEGAATGGKYIFRSALNADQVNLYNGAELQLNSFIQENGDRTAGDFSVSNLTSTGNGNIIALWDGNLGHEHFGNVTLNNDTSLRLEGRVDSSMDFVSASDFHGVGKFIINYIYLHADGEADEKTYAIADSVLKDHIEAVSNVTVLGVYTRNAYDVTYTTDENFGYLTFKKNGGNLYNLVGFLAKDTEGTAYSLTTDENVCNPENDQIGNMAGTNNTKTVNAGDYSIYGNGFAGVLVKAGQSLTINGGVWQDFKNNVVDTSGTSVLTVRDAIFINNIAPDQGGAALDLNLGSTNYIYDSNFINSVGTYTNSGGAIWNRATTTITAQNKDVLFENNTTEGIGGAIYNMYDGGNLTISATGGDVIFKNNTATQGGVIYNEGTLDISASNDHKVVFEGNNENGAFTSGTGGGAIANTGTLSIKNAIFKNNTTSGWNAGGAAISSSAGSISEIVAEFTNNSALGSGGAIWNYTNIDNIDGFFKGNNAYYYGGAIYNQYVSIGTIIGDFIENYVDNSKDNSFEAHGGAIDNYNKNSSVSSISANFTGNYAKSPSSAARGGAISNAGPIGEITDSNFTNNYTETSGASALGGAIYNDNIITNIQNSSFSGNYVSGNDDSKGGAIYNEGTIGFSGTNTFTNNKANEVPNDIYNAGTININGGTTTLNSGYIGSETSALTVKSGATLTANAALEVADGGTLTNESGGTLAVSADNLKIDETTNNGTLELEGGNVTTKLMGTGRMKLMSGNVRLLSSTPPATTGSLSFGSSSDYADSILTSSSAASTSDHALVTAGYLDNNYYMNYGDSMTKSFTKAVNDNHKSVIVRSAKHDVTIFERKSDNTATTTKQAA